MKLKLNKEQVAVISAFLSQTKLGNDNKYESAISDLCIKYDDRLNWDDHPTIKVEYDVYGDRTFVIKE